MSNDGAIGAGGAGARGGSFPKPVAACRGASAAGPVRAGGLEAAMGKGIPAGPASCASGPGSGGALTVPNQPRRGTRPTIARTAMAARPRGRRTNWLRSSITLTRHHRVRRVNSGASRRRVGSDRTRQPVECVVARRAHIVAEGGSACHRTVRSAQSRCSGRCQVMKRERGLMDGHLAQARIIGLAQARQ
jgi:hypothetical protein